jgi:hypothetical protein
MLWNKKVDIQNDLRIIVLRKIYILKMWRVMGVEKFYRPLNRDNRPFIKSKIERMGTHSSI